MTESSKTFNFVGVSMYKGEPKARYTNDTFTRIKVMLRSGHSDVVFTELLRPMTKAEISNEGWLANAMESYKRENAVMQNAG